MTPEMWTIIGVGVALSSIGTGGFTLLWRYIAAAEKRSEDRAAAIEKRADARIVELRADIRMLAERMERNHADLRHAIDTMVLDDQAKRLTISRGGRAPQPYGRRPRSPTLTPGIILVSGSSSDLPALDFDGAQRAVGRRA